MYVTKRNNKGKELFDVQKIKSRINKLTNNLNVNVNEIVDSTAMNIYDGISTSELDTISAKISYDKSFISNDYKTLATRIFVSNLHKQTPSSFVECTLKHKPRLSKLFIEYIKTNKEELDKIVDHNRDYDIQYLSYKTLQRGYLMSVDNITYDRPQYLYLRISISLYLGDLEKIRECYNVLSKHYITHATPTMFNAGTINQQLLSCFLLGTEDSVEGIMKTVSDCSIMSKYSGGIGVHMTNVRCLNQPVRKTGGKSLGVPSQCMIYNAVACCWNQGGKRKGAISLYIEPHQADIIDFLKLKLNNDGGLRARDLFYAIWIPDLFIEAVHNSDDWCLFSENVHHGLSSVYDGMMVCSKCFYCQNPSFAKYIKSPLSLCQDHQFTSYNAYTELYHKYKPYCISKIKARDVLDAIVQSQQESGGPSICFKDHVNRQSNHANVGTIKSSNLCTEIMEYSSNESYATCALSSINLPKFIKTEDINSSDIFDKFCFSSLRKAVKLAVRNLNKILDVNEYPLPECKSNSKTLRSLGIGIQGLADLFIELDIPYLSANAEKLDIAIAESIYYAALSESIKLAKINGSYSFFNGSPLSRGEIAPDLWKKNKQHIKSDMWKNISSDNEPIYSGLYDWNKMRDNVKKGVYNSLLVAYMPTVSTSKILGNNESFEPIPSCIYNTTTLNGKFIVVNDKLIKKLSDIGLWNQTMRDKIINNNGSIQSIPEIPKNIQELFLTVWEMPQNMLIKRAAQRGAWIDQAQSLNMHFDVIDQSTLRGAIITGWKMGIKTGIYYVRSKPAADNKIINKQICNENVCTSCSS